MKIRHGGLKTLLNGKESQKRAQDMCNESILTFVMFIIYALADAWGKLPYQVYHILDSTGILTDYVIGCYDTLHTLGKNYLVEDITEFVREKGATV